MNNRVIGGSSLLRNFEILYLGERNGLRVLLRAGEEATLMLLEVFVVLSVSYFACDFETGFEILHA